MAPRLNAEDLEAIKILMEKALNLELLTREPTIILENMDIAKKVMYLEHLEEIRPQKRGNF